jgi:hypothetical protein
MVMSFITSNGSTYTPTSQSSQSVTLRLTQFSSPSGFQALGCALYRESDAYCGGCFLFGHRLPQRGFQVGVLHPTSAPPWTKTTMDTKWFAAAALLTVSANALFATASAHTHTSTWAAGSFICNSARLVYPVRSPTALCTGALVFRRWCGCGDARWKEGLGGSTLIFKPKLMRLDARLRSGLL